MYKFGLVYYLDINRVDCIDYTNISMASCIANLAFGNRWKSFGMETGFFRWCLVSKKLRASCMAVLLQAFVVVWRFFHFFWILPFGFGTKPEIRKYLSFEYLQWLFELLSCLYELFHGPRKPFFAIYEGELKNQRNFCSNKYIYYVFSTKFSIISTKKSSKGPCLENMVVRNESSSVRGQIVVHTPLYSLANVLKFLNGRIVQQSHWGNKFIEHPLHFTSWRTMIIILTCVTSLAFSGHSLINSMKALNRFFVFLRVVARY